MQFFTKNNEGEFVEVNVDEVFKDRKQRWEEQEGSRLREEATTSVRSELTKTITSEVESRVKGEYESKLKQATEKSAQLETSLRQKTIAAEYGFKPETESFLGNGTDEEMRKAADTLKNSFNSKTTAPAPDKKTSDTSQTVGFVTKKG